MKRSVCLRSALRQPAQTLVLVLLAGLITFAFVSRVVEYLVVSRETDRLAGYYRSIGTLHRIAPVPDDWGIEQGVELVSESQYVAFEDLRRHCSGVLQGIYNSDVDGGRSVLDLLTYDVVFYGKLLSKAHLPGAIEEYRFNFEADNAVTGFPEYVQEGSEVNLKFFPKYVNVRDSVQYILGIQGLKYIPGNPDEMDAPYQLLEIGARYLIRACCDPAYRGFYMNEKGESAGDFLTIKPLQSGVWFQEVEPGVSVDLADPAWARLAEELAVMEENQHAMRVTGTSDMSSMPDTQEASRYLYLTKGRWLDSEDNLEGRRVCVVHNDFAVRRGLSVGDTITLKLRDLKNLSSGGYIVPGKDWDAWQGYATHTEEFEIVGLYGRLSPYPQATVVSTYVYIPDSCMPAGYYSREGIWEGDYSFALASSEHEDDFLAETRQALEGLGIQVSFVESGWNNFQAAAVPLKQSLVINVRVFSAVLVPVMALASFLYLWQRRRDFAILRSMGMPKREATGQLVWSMAAIGATGVTVGGLLSWGYSLRKAANTLASLQGPKGAGSSADLSLAWLAGLCALAIAVLLSFTVAGASAVSQRPVLELLQGTESRAVRKRRPVAGAEGGGGHLEKAPLVLPDTVQFETEGGIARSLGKTPATRDLGRALSSRYVLRHIRRAPLKSILTVSVALGFTLALGWLNWSIERNNAKLDELYRATKVEAEIVRVNPSLGTASGFIPSGEVYSVLQTGFVKDAYLVATANASLVGTFVDGEQSKRDYMGAAERVPLLGFTQPEWFFSERTRNIAVEYAEGCDESLLSNEWTDQSGGQFPVVLPVATMSQLRLQLGDKVWIQHNTSFRSIDCRVVGQYTGTIISGGSQTPILLPLSVLKILVASDLGYSVARFAIDPERNRELPEFRAEMSELFADDGNKGVVDTTLIFWDNQMTQVVEPMEKSLLLIKILHSVTVTVSALIAAGLGALMVLQSAKEAAIMRVLGVTKRLARSTLCGEQALLCFVGLVLGLGALAILRGRASAALTFPALGCAALYLAGCLIGAWQGARSVTDRSPLELLQVKE